jgi:sarcosine oxidase subunit gamma
VSGRTSPWAGWERAPAGARKLGQQQNSGRQEAANVYQQRPGRAKAESPLHHADLASLVGKGRKNAGVTLREKKLLGHLTIRGDGHDPAFAAGVHKALGLELPVALTVVANGDTSAAMDGPGRVAADRARRRRVRRREKLREALGDLHIQVVNVSGGQPCSN